MDQNNSWMNPRQFTRTTDYVNPGPMRTYTSDHSLPSTSRGESESQGYSRFQFTPNTPNSRPLSSILPKMPAQNLFAPTSVLFREDETVESLGPRALLQNSVSYRGSDANLKRKLAEEVQIPEKIPRFSAQSFSHDEPNTTKPVQKRRRQFVKPEPRDFKRILIGSVEHVIRWYKVAKDAKLSFLYEAIGTLDNYTARRSTHLLFLKGELGQIIQGLFYSTDHELPPLELGATYSMTGKMVGSRKMVVIDAKEIQPNEKAAVQRLTFLCQRMLNLAAGNSADVNI